MREMVKIIFRQDEYEIKPGMSVQHALEKVGMDSNSVLVTRMGELLTDDEILHAGDVVRLVAVISGGGK